MTSKDSGQDQELLDRYRRASDTDPAAPSDAVRSAILAEGRRVAGQLAAKGAPTSFDASRRAANDSRWKITAFGTAGAALLAALLFAPRYWENAAPARVSMAPASEPARPPKLEEVRPQSAPSYTAQAERKASKQLGAPRPKAPIAAPPATPAAPGAEPNYAPVSPDLPAFAASAPPMAAAHSSPRDFARALGSNALAARGGSVSADSAPMPASLESAIAQGDVAGAAALLDKGARIDAPDELGRTPLMLAVTQDRLGIVRLLLARGADPSLADNTGHTPLQQATKRNLREVEVLLEQAGAR